MPRQEIIDQFIDKLFEDYEDALIEGDIDVILDYFEKHYRELGPDFEPVFVKVITNIMDKSDLEKYKQKFGYFLYLYLANFFGIEDVYISGFKLDRISDKWRFNSLQWRDWGYERPFTFKTVTIEYTPQNLSFACDLLLKCDEVIVTGNNIKGQDLRLSWDVTTITFKTYVNTVNIKSCNNICFDDNSVTYENNIPVLTKDFTVRNSTDVTTIMLPEVDRVQVPRWMCSRLNNDKLTIYKQPGQKINIFSVYKDWLKEHVKSI